MNNRLEYFTYSDLEYVKKHIKRDIYLPPINKNYHICNQCRIGFLSSLYEELEMMYGPHFATSDGTLLTEEEQEDLIIQKEMNEIDTDMESLESIQFLEDTFL